ncbi:MAG: peptidase T [Anaeromicrobium sp.]|jgi:tripeptide aminopeptidase|uniref:peptidase T n=1 Tax=Anaeromicrobium sp. TaxID=1929132 RepID=UPI0026001C06|nr:peptidase T [Anaeromicrobium sp.]MCT4595538.1 peptidase T [Anaeromicrobium sp.]
MESIIDRFFKYVEYETTSDENSDTCPSSKSQCRFAKLLKDELEYIGLTHVYMDEFGYVYGTIEANTKREVPTIGFIAHMDTSPDTSGKDVKPKIIKEYDGGKILLNEEKNIVLCPKEFPELKNYVGQDIITTDGTTLLGADDKAGIAEIVTAMEYIINNPNIKHGKIKVAFTPDEEIGRGADRFNVEKFNAKYAYTIDGGEIGELEYENFNGAYAKIKIKGVNVHPGIGKNKMKNSILMGMELNSIISSKERPANTEKYEGFYHLNHIRGNVENTEMYYIIRDHSMEEFKEKKNRIEKIVNYINDKYGENTISLEMKDQYYNMREKIEPVMEVVNIAKVAMEQVGIKPKIKPIRGGTDGARLSFMGLPCPNIFTGGHNFHGRFEYIPVQSMLRAVETIVKIVQLYEENVR